jgi:carbohydrate kinase (thermoresistant glucokinase family)
MGVTGAGKSTIGSALALELGVPFIDADSLHPRSNVDKMSAGIPLADEDRAPWLDIVGALLADAEKGLVVACSALKRAYRERITGRAPNATFIHLTVSDTELARRLAGRAGHFMPASLLKSQLETLEPLGPDENGFAVAGGSDPAEVVAAIKERLGEIPSTTA